jgi:hypothetical protein
MRAVAAWWEMLPWPAAALVVVIVFLAGTMLALAACSHMDPLKREKRQILRTRHRRLDALRKLRADTDRVAFREYFRGEKK